jgi:hypothetical protein
MNNIKYLMLTALLSLSAFTNNVTAKTIVVPKMYMFGFAASFNDSIVHMTDIQLLDSVWVDQKSRLLAGRENYSYQLRDFLAQQRQLPHRTCVVYYSRDRKKIEKDYLKMKRLYTLETKKARKKNKATTFVPYDLRELSPSDFRFQIIDMSGGGVE